VAYPTNHNKSELPPRARRIQSSPLVAMVPMGTTSACAENTCFPQRTDTLHRNYLRVRGEYLTAKVGLAYEEELPPRARRILDHKPAPATRGGTTSACAENTRRQRNIRLTTRNYLRVRGEYNIWGRRASDLEELPPRARRIPTRVATLHIRVGTTSACAENTRQLGNDETLAGNYLRVRGEYARSRKRCSNLPELPPRARRIRHA